MNAAAICYVKSSEWMDHSIPPPSANTHRHIQSYTYTHTCMLAHNLVPEQSDFTCSFSLTVHFCKSFCYCLNTFVAPTQSKDFIFFTSLVCVFLFPCMYNSLAHLHPLRSRRCVTVTNFPFKASGVYVILLAVPQSVSLSPAKPLCYAKEWKITPFAAPLFITPWLSCGELRVNGEKGRRPLCNYVDWWLNPVFNFWCLAQLRRCTRTRARVCLCCN